MRRRHQVTLYIVAEPALGRDAPRSLSPAWQISFVYPEGPLDAEAVAVDTANERVLVLSKRTIPARLYELPLRPSQTGSVVTARHIATLDSLPQPSARDLQRALPQRSWHWQPTGMDLAPDNRAAVILTYRAVYYFARNKAQSWSQALQAPPLRLDLGGNRHAESVAISRDGNTVFVTVEGRNPPLLRFDRQPRTDLPRPPQ
ncbi:MAG: hypothetical protein BMS9Abin32_296 [Gammaproteobacteria bacterium]|nr:MAG: hypothetical protein BMS9Abin32_296 [Gammaproteobacteria bacterium]